MTHAIKRLTLTNFQSHQDTEITPAPPGGLTVIVGPSGHGKTAVLRALRWLLYNQPQGMGFMRVGASTVQVTAELIGGAVTRRRTASTNQYIAVTEAAGRQVFEGFAGTVPLEIRQLTGVREIQVADLTIAPNFAEQLDGPFLGERVTSAGTRAKVLGRIAGIDEVDLAAKSLATDQFRRGQEEKRLEREVADLAAREAQFAHLPELRRRIEALDALAEELTQAEERRAIVTRAAEQLRQIRAARQQAQAIVDRWASSLPMVEASLARTEAATARQGHVATLAARHRTVQMGLQAAQATLIRWAGADQTLDLLLQAETDSDRRSQVGLLIFRLIMTRQDIARARATLERWRSAGAALDLLLATALTTAHRDRLATALGRLRQTGNSIAALQGALRRLAGATQATEVLAQTIIATGRWGTLLRLQTSLAPIAPAKQAVAAAVARAEKVQAALAALTTIDQTLTHRNRAAALGMGLMMCRMGIEQTEGRAAAAQRQAKEAEQAYIDTLTTAGRCPVCGGDIHPEHLKEAV